MGLWGAHHRTMICNPELFWGGGGYKVPSDDLQSEPIVISSEGKRYIWQSDKSMRFTPYRLFKHSETAVQFKHALCNGTLSLGKKLLF